MKKFSTVLSQNKIMKLFCLISINLLFVCFSVGCGGEKIALTGETIEDYLKIDYTFTDAISASKLAMRNNEGGYCFYINPVLRVKVLPANEESEYNYGGTVELEIIYYFHEIQTNDLSPFYTPNGLQKQSTVKISLSENGSGETTVVSGYSKYVKKYYYARVVYYKITNVNAYIINKAEKK